MSTGKVDLSGEELTVGIDGMLTFDESVDATDAAELLRSYQFPFLSLEVEGHMIPGLETDDGRYVGLASMERFLRQRAQRRAAI